MVKVRCKKCGSIGYTCAPDILACECGGKLAEIPEEPSYVSLQNLPSMKKISRILEKPQLSQVEIEILIVMIKEGLWPKMVENGKCRSCSDCVLFEACKLIGKKMICPWLV